LSEANHPGGRKKSINGLGRGPKARRRVLKGEKEYKAVGRGTEIQLSIKGA